MIHASGFVLASISLSMPSLALGVLLGLVVLGMGILAFTAYRYVIGYFLVGMVYWLLVEGLHWVVTSVSPLTETNAYIAAVALSLLPLWGLLAYKPRRRTTHEEMPVRLGAGQRPFVLEKDTDFRQHYIRHTPVIDVES